MIDHAPRLANKAKRAIIWRIVILSFLASALLQAALYAIVTTPLTP